MKFNLPILLLVFIFSTAYTQENGFKEVQLTDNNSNNRYSSYNKEGTKILFESDRDGRWQIYIMDIDGNGESRVLTSTSNDRRPTWHPFKNMILFESDRSGTNELYTYDIDTKALKMVPIPLEGHKSYAEFFSNGVELIFCLETEKGNKDIYRVHKKGKLLRKLVSNEQKNRYPKASRRGDFVLYTSDKNNTQDTDVIYNYSVLQKSNNKISFFKDDCSDASWPNVTNRLVFSGLIDKEDHTTTEIYTMQTDGSRKLRITYNEQDDSLPHWSPNDINILVTRRMPNGEQIFKILLKEPL
ncbi:hypothetical protein Q2T40_07560 [Winogradskyella maritima]|uniref:WD40 repeat protein n=1 Tax=Winogradskyella maritima TaxID=1517766 RepID=A0ABV8AJM9_9FLAO|nr:hypothetical protein [Winogradskyella maritima]